LEYRRFGRTNLKMSVFSLGGMRYPRGGEEPHDVLPDETLEAAYQTSQEAVKLGINHIETAYGYGKSERVYGKIIPRLSVSREKLIITTKVSPHNSADEFKRMIDQSLERLGLSYLDNLAIHGVNVLGDYENIVKKNGCLEVLEKYRQDGLIRHIGFSTHATLSVILKTIETDAFDFVNLHFYYVFQRNLPAVKLAKAHDMGVFIISPNDKGGQLFDPPQKLAELTAPLSPMNFNTRFCLSYPEITTLSLGASKPSEIQPHLKALTGGYYFTPEDLAIKLRVDAQILNLGKDYCTGCGECLPCPEKINIPETLRLRNLDVAYGMRKFGQYRYKDFRPDDKWFNGAYGDQCTECGDCLPRCPVRLEIPRLVKDTHQRFYVKKSVASA